MSYSSRNSTPFQKWTIKLLFGCIFTIIASCCGTPDNQPNSDTSPEYVTKFGCNFYPPGTKFPTLLDYEEKTPPLTFGKEVEPLVLTSEYEFKALKQKLYEINKHVLTKFMYNSMDKYIRFYDDYKRSGLPFETFFYRYQYPFVPAEDCVTQAIKVLDKAHYYLKSRWPTLPSHTYIVAGRMAIPDAWEANMENVWKNGISEEHPDAEHLVMNARMRHAMGVVKFSLQGRVGYILIEQGYSWARPAVVMEDEQPPHEGRFVDDDDVHKFSFIFNKAYLLWKISWEDDESTITETRLLYLRRPFCSFLANTAKYDLLRPTRIYLSRDETGQTKGGMDFNLDNGMNSMAFMLRHERLPQPFMTTMSFEYLTPSGLRQLKKVKPEAAETFIENVGFINQFGGFQPGALLKRAQKIAEIVQDESFQQGLREMRARRKEIEKNLEGTPDSPEEVDDPEEEEEEEEEAFDQ